MVAGRSTRTPGTGGGSGGSGDVVGIRFTGPLFSSQAGRVITEWNAACVERLADFALERVQYHLDANIRNPTPYYETQINIREISRTERSVNDRGVVYGPWLEGTSSRNDRTRFKGYASFRKATSETRANIGDLTIAATREAVRRLDG